MKSSRPTKRGYLFLSYLEKFAEVSANHLKTFTIRWVRISTIGLAYLSNLDVCSTASGARVEREPSKWWCLNQLFGVKYIKHSNWWRRQRYSWLGDVILTLYWLSSFYLVVNLYYQYSLDFDKLRVMRLKAMFNEGLVSGNEFYQLAAIFLNRIDETTSILRKIGAPHRHMSMVIESVYLSMLLFALSMYYSRYIFYQIVMPFEFHFIRDLLDPEEEKRQSSALIESQLMLFIESSKAFAKLRQGSIHESISSCDQEGCPNYLILRKRLHLQRHATNGTKASLICSIIEDRQDQMPNSYDILKQMNQSGALRPFNKSLESFKNINKRLSMSLVLLLTFVVLFFPTLIQGSLARRDTSGPLTWSDLIIVSTLFVLVLVIGSSGGLTGALFSASSFDQELMVEKMREIILTCISNNNYEFRHLNANEESYLSIQNNAKASNLAKRSTRAQIKRLKISSKLGIHKMNANLLFVLLQYKIFLAQYKPARESFQLGMGLAILLPMIILINIKLHMPYLSMYNFNNIKWFSIAISAATLLPVNFVIVPICRLDSRFTNLYRVLSSLIAHITEVGNHPDGREIYDQHAVSLLLREVRNPHQLNDRSWSQLVEIEASYTSLVRNHFWFGIVVLSILVDNRDYSDIRQQSTSFLDDPFSVFSPSNFLKLE